MHDARDDSIKTRLTERAQLMVAAGNLVNRGVPLELIPVHLARLFYVDVDELNAVLDMITVKTGAEVQPQREMRRSVA